jgi:hypothetical protein
MDDLIADMLHTPLFDQAERVRWRMSEIPWDRIDRAAASEPLRALVKEIAFAELTTFSATRRFMTDLADDVDFTQWISVWFYEETKHPQALLRWLHHLGVGVDDKFIMRGRATSPFMKSRMGTLVTNIISEMVASAAYTRLYRESPEPVLALIGRNLAGDEARHAASFYVYAQRHLERSTDRDADRRDALKVLYMWFHSNELVSHPVNELNGRNEQRTGLPGLDLAASRDRISRVIGSLIDVELDQGADLVTQLRQLGARAQAPGGHPGGHPGDHHEAT